MKTKKTFTSFLITSILFFLLGANHYESAASSPSSSGCMTINPGTLTYGLRTTPDEQFLSVTSSGTWGAYVSGGWIKINGGGTLSSGGNATISVTLSNPPAGQPYIHVVPSPPVPSPFMEVVETTSQLMSITLIVFAVRVISVL